jgi:CDGSH-type Zn-finger protein
MIKSDREGPYKLEPQDKPVFICGCGLTSNWPFCDGSHKACKMEEAGKVYVYDENKNVVEEWDDS